MLNITWYIYTPDPTGQCLHFTGVGQLVIPKTLLNEVKNQVLLCQT